MRDISTRRRRRAGRSRRSAAEELRRRWLPGRASLPTPPDRARFVRGPGPGDRQEGERPAREETRPAELASRRGTRQDRRRPGKPSDPETTGELPKFGASRLSELPEQRLRKTSERAG